MGAAKNDQHNRKDNRSRGGDKPAKVSFGNYRFLSFNLTADEKEDCKADYIPQMNPLVVVADLVIVGYKLSVSAGKGDGTYTASLTCNAPDDPNAGLIITAHSNTISGAILVLGYKVLVLAGDRGWAEVESERGGGGDDIG